MKDPKTTSIAIVGAIILFALVSALIFKKIDVASFTAAIASVGAFLGVLVGLFASDSKKGGNA